MATPDAEETVAAPPSTAEAVVAKAEGGDKETAKSPEATTKEAPKTAEEGVTTETAQESVEQELPESAPVEPSIPEFKEESNLVSDLKESEKKALEEFKIRIEKAIKDNEFKVPKKVVEAPKEPEPVATPVEEKKEEATPADAPSVTASEAPSSTEVAVPAAETPEAVEVTSVVTVVAAVDEKIDETSSMEAPKEIPVAVIVTETVAPAPAPEVETETSAPAPAPDAAPAAVEAPATAPAAEPESTPSPLVEAETKEEAAPVVEAAKEVPVEEEPEDTTPPEDISLWGVPLLHTKGDKRTDVILLKFLRARDFNVTDAFNQLKKTIIWRKTFKADNLLDEEFGSDLDGVAYMHGKDKEGHPVCYNVYGGFQDKELYQKTFGDASKINAFLRWRIQVLEKGIKLLNFSPEGPSAMVQITDLKNSPGPGKKDLKSAANQAVNLLQDNYPELVAKKVFINVPWYFSALYSIVSPFLSQRTKSKFVVAPAGKTTEALLKFIPAEYIPVNYGGLSKLNDTEFSGGDAPAIEVVVKAGEKKHIEIPVTEVGGSVVWDVAVVGYDVSYGAEYQPSAEGAYTTIIEKTKKLPSTTEEPIRNSFKISEPGKVVLTVDNSSRKKKIVIYRHTVKNATASESELAG